MTRIDIFSGFLGAGKTTLIKKLIKEAFAGEKLVLIENEFGEIGIDGGFMKDAGIEVTEMNSGCICCSLVGDFGTALKKVIAQYSPDRILIEPSGVGKLSDVMIAVRNAAAQEAVLGDCVAVADATKCKMYMKNFGEFYNNQIESAACIVLSRTDAIPEEKLEAAVQLIRQRNPQAVLITTPWNQLTGEQMKQAMESAPAIEEELARLLKEHEAHDDDCCCHEHHHHDDDDEHEHHHDDHDEHHHHDHDEHEHHHHHHADEVFTSWGRETAKKFTEETLRYALTELDNTWKYGMVLRAKGIVQAQDGRWLHFDHVPGEVDIRYGTPEVIGRLCVIGAKLDEAAIAELFGL